MGRGALLQFDQAGVAHSSVGYGLSLGGVVHAIDIP